MCDEHYNSIRAYQDRLRTEARMNAVIAEAHGKTKRGYLLNNVPQHSNSMHK